MIEKTQKGYASMNWFSLLTAFGVGSIVSLLIQDWLAQRSKKDERSFRERQAAYIGLLEAYHQAAVEGTDTAAKNFAYWQMRCELVAPEYVRKAIKRIIETDGDHIARSNAHDELMRRLGAISVSRDGRYNVIMIDG